MNIDLEKYNYTCYIVGGGSSLLTFKWELLNDKFVIAINSAYTKLPKAQVCYMTDPPWVKDNEEGLKKHRGLKYQGVLRLNVPKKLDVVDRQWHLTGPKALETKKGCLSHGSNSTMAATNMAAIHLGFKKIYLLGIDMKWGKKGKKDTSHWHSATHPHKRVDGEIGFARMLENWKTIKQPLLDKGITVINVNTPEGTDLKEFPIKSIKEVFNLK